MRERRGKIGHDCFRVSCRLAKKNIILSGSSILNKPPFGMNLCDRSLNELARSDIERKTYTCIQT